MGTLANPRHEKFARLVWAASAKDYRRALAYLAAGYRAKLDLSQPSKSHPADQAASRLAKSIKVKARIMELSTMAAKRHEITQDTLLEELEQARQAALSNNQASAAVAASMGKAKLCGMIVERKESGKLGDFDNMTIEELKAFIQADLDSKPSTHGGKDTEH
jgi:hypothetical protein